MHEIRDIFSTVKRNSTLFIPAVYNRQIAHFVTKVVAKCWLIHRRIIFLVAIITKYFKDNAGLIKDYSVRRKWLDNIYNIEKVKQNLRQFFRLQHRCCLFVCLVFLCFRKTKKQQLQLTTVRLSFPRTI